MCEDTVVLWEKHGREPSIRQWPAIIALLGEYPFPTETGAEQLLAYRRQEGLTQQELADRLGVSEWSIRQKEKGGVALVGWTSGGSTEEALKRDVRRGPSEVGAEMTGG